MAFDTRDFAQTHYFAEIERKKELNSNVSLPVTLASGYAAAIVTMARSIESPIDLLGWLTILGCAVASAGLLFALYSLYRAYVGHPYRYVATPDRVLTWREQARAGRWTGRALDIATNDMLAGEYSEAAAQNALTNDRKSGFLNRANASLGAVLAILLLTAVPWMLENARSKAQTSNSVAISVVLDNACRRQFATAIQGSGASPAAASEPGHKGKRDSEREKGRLTVGAHEQVSACIAK